MKSLDSQSDLLPDSPYGSNRDRKIADFVFLPYISFINAFTALECFKRYWKTISAEFIQLVIFTL